MKTARRDQAHRGQPSLLDSIEPMGVSPGSSARQPMGVSPGSSATATPDLPPDEGKKSRNETYREVKDKFPNCKEMWLARIIAAGPGGITAYELSEKYNTPQNVFSGRITALAEERRVVRTSLRRKTKTSDAAVIVAAEFLVNEQLSQEANAANHRGPRRSRDPEDTMPDALTNPRAQRDVHGDLLEHDAEYAIYDHGKLVAGRVKVYEDDLGNWCAVRMGSSNARPQRIDEMTKGMRWEKLK